MKAESVTQSFDIEIAMIVGERAAVIYKNLKFWISLNQKKGHNIRDGRAWVHFSISELAKYFPYLTEKQVRTACYKLKASGLINTANYNQWANDHTTWFGLPILSDQTGKPAAESVSSDDQTSKPAAQMGKALPDTNPDSYPNTDPDINHAHPFDRKTQGIPQPIAEQLEKYREKVQDFGKIGRLMVPVDCAIAIVGPQIVHDAIAQVIAEAPNVEPKFRVTNIVKLLGDEQRLRERAAKYQSESIPIKIQPEYLSDAESMSRLVDIKRRIGQQLTPQEIEACKQHQIAYA